MLPEEGLAEKVYADVCYDIVLKALWIDKPRCLLDGRAPPPAAIHRRTMVREGARRWMRHLSAGVPPGASPVQPQASA